MRPRIERGDVVIAILGIFLMLVVLAMFASSGTYTGPGTGTELR